MMSKRAILVGMALLWGVSGPALGQNLEQRLQHLERLVGSQALLEMMQRLDRQEQELQQLRGRLEEQEHTIEGLRHRQRELYLDTDRRLSRIEREGLSGTVAPSGEKTSSGPVLLAPVAAAPAVSEERMQQEREAYQQAFDLLRELRYEQASEAFRAFLQQYPDGRHAHIAQYWLGEASYAQRKFEQAIGDYQKLLERHPNSPKRAEAMLKIAYSWNELKQPDKARPILERLINDFPGSTEAGQARNLLGQL